jgi:hypothetical protein
MRVGERRNSMVTMSRRKFPFAAIHAGLKPKVCISCRTRIGEGNDRDERDETDPSTATTAVSKSISRG